ncbi:acyloxyacyl hydrolase [Fulvivirga sp. RKSG066]|uniref:acyloxyacyl hydrolase n=1 Tax=Fulvivirga aurantia TaxID=2529383 RepID=UPI0012BCFFFE|nr:acyloxyacyl hydrolase [Fulvivirga aurantia]MTI20570.1 acyloxyacyl hydrolase [Fulvivirga aurantia]
MKVLVAILLLIPGLSLAQFSGEGERILHMEYMHGFILKHKKQISHLIIGHPQGIRATLVRQTNGSERWHQRYNYPEAGLSLIYLDYQNPSLGKSIALIPHYNVYFTKNRQAKSRWKYQIGLGLGYNTNKYHRETNNQNNVLGTDLNFGISMQLQHQYQITKDIALLNSVSLTHFSNGSIRKPNSGINTVSFNTGIAYSLSKKAYSYNFNQNDPIDKEGLGYTATLSFGMHEATKIGAGSYPFFVLSALADKTLNHKSKLGIAIEWFYSESLKRDIKFDPELAGEEGPDFNRIGIALSHELVLGDFSVMSQLGYYVYDPYKPFTSVYIRAGLRRYFNDNLFASLCVKSHHARAEAAEFALGWRFK